MNARSILQMRADIRRRLRACFDDRGFVEVDTPVLATEVLPEAFIDPLAVPMPGTDAIRYLQASPEALMKRLLAAGSGPIYQFARCFRAGERGPQHDVEFVLLEWYEPGATLDSTCDLLETLCETALGTRGIQRTTCADAFRTHAGVDPLTADLDALLAAAARARLAVPAGLDALPVGEARDRVFELLLAERVQPHLGRERPTMLDAWPASQAAFAQLDAEGVTARRFELFVAGVELANGWEEETSRDVLATRIEAANRIRAADGRQPLPVPARLLAAHGPAMPQGVGAALGFDRLVMLAAGAGSIDAVRSFSSGDA
jgi:lysyl-tRNA synthetase class 2